MSSRRQERKAVRRANRIAAVDPEKPKRIFRRYFSIVLVVIIVIVEGAVLLNAYNEYSRSQSIQLAEDLSVDLSLINSALRQGNRAGYSRQLQDFRDNLKKLNGNTYIMTHNHSLVTKLNAYDKLLEDDAPIIAQMIDINIAISAVTIYANEAQDTDIDAAKIYRLIDSYQNLRNDLAAITVADFTDIKDKMISYIDEMLPYLERAVVCVGVCTGQILEDKQAEISAIIDRHEPEITEISLASSEKYNPNELILELGAYSKP